MDLEEDPETNKWSNYEYTLAVGYTGGDDDDNPSHLLLALLSARGKFESTSTAKKISELRQEARYLIERARVVTTTLEDAVDGRELVMLDWDARGETGSDDGNDILLKATALRMDHEDETLAGRIGRAAAELEYFLPRDPKGDNKDEGEPVESFFNEGAAKFVRFSNTPIARGGFSTVFVYRESISSSPLPPMSNSRLFAGKELETVGGYTHDLMKEVLALIKLKGDHIVEYIGIRHSKKINAIITELCLCSLGDILRREDIFTATGTPPTIETFSAPSLDFEAAERCALHVALGLKSVHNAGFMHRDLKPKNVLMAFNGAFKIADFGFAKEYLDYVSNTQGKGTRYYRAPEVISGRTYTPAADLYSLGVLYMDLFVLFDKTPKYTKKYFENRKKSHEDSSGGEKPIDVVFPTGKAEMYSEPIEALTRFIPQDRPTLDSVLNFLKTPIQNSPLLKEPTAMAPAQEKIKQTQASMSIDKESAACITTLRRLGEQGLLDLATVGQLIQKVPLPGFGFLKSVITKESTNLRTLAKVLDEMMGVIKMTD